MAVDLPVLSPGSEELISTDHGDGIQHHHVGSTFDVLIGPLDKLLNWGRSNSAWPFGFGLCCCFIEFISMSAARFDIARFGSEVIRPSPRQCDVMIVSGTLTKKMTPAVVRLFQQMAEPRYVIAMGNCAVSGGIFSGGYSQVDGVDQVLPVDIYLPGCPPRPEALMHSIIELQKRIRTESLIKGRRLQPAIPPGTKVAHPWGAPEQVFRKLYKRFFDEPAEHAAAPAAPRPAAPAQRPAAAAATPGAPAATTPAQAAATSASTTPAAEAAKPAASTANAGGPPLASDAAPGDASAPAAQLEKGASAENPPTGTGTASAVGPEDDTPGLAPKGGPADPAS